MKTLKCLVVAGLALASAMTARAELSARGWLETYYLNPKPAELGSKIQALSREGYFEESGHVAIAIGFISTVFTKNPELVDNCLLQLNGLPLAHHRLVAGALWQAGLPLGSDMLRALDQNSRIRPQVDRLAADGAVPILETPVLSPSSMNLHWGAFLASGDERHITSILFAIGTDRAALDTAARVTLAKNAAAHPRVLEICRDELARHPNEVPSELKAALLDVMKTHPQS